MAGVFPAIGEGANRSTRERPHIGGQAVRSPARFAGARKPSEYQGLQ